MALQPSWPGLTRPSTRLRPHDRGSALPVRFSPLGRTSSAPRLRSGVAWMAGSSPAMTGLFVSKRVLPSHAEPQEAASQARRPRLFGRARHVDHPQVAADRIWRGGHHLHRRSRPGRGARARAQEGRAAWHQARAHFHRGRARGIRARLRLPDVPRQRAIRGPVPARHLDRAAADRQASGRDRPQNGR